MIASVPQLDKSKLSVAAAELLQATENRARHRQRAITEAIQKRGRWPLLQHASAAGSEAGVWEVAENPNATADDLLAMLDAYESAMADLVAIVVEDPNVPDHHAAALAYRLGQRSGLRSAVAVADDPKRLQGLVDRCADLRDAAAVECGVAG